MPEPSATPDAPETPETPAAPAPQFVTVEDYKRLEQTIAGQNELIASVNASLQALASRAAAPPAAAAPSGDLTDEQIDAAVEEGRMTATQASRLIAKREAARLAKEQIDPLRDTGTGALSGVVRELALPKMPHYTRYKAEIDKYLEQIPAQAKLSPDTYIAAHNLVVGQHMQELLDAEREAAIRSAAAPKPEAAAPATRTGRTNTTGQVPSVEELMGSDAARALESKGLNPDQFAKRLGYKDWGAYAELATKGGA